MIKFFPTDNCHNRWRATQMERPLPLGMGETVLLELMLDTEEEEDDVFLLLSTTLWVWMTGALTVDGLRSTGWENTKDYVSILTSRLLWCFMVFIVSGNVLFDKCRLKILKQDPTISKLHLSKKVYLHQIWLTKLLYKTPLREHILCTAIECTVYSVPCLGEEYFSSQSGCCWGRCHWCLSWH